ncbi:MAG: diacylglycerol kinase family protein [Aestuariivirga sp.]
MDEARLMRAGLLVNPRSGKSSGKGLGLAEKLGGTPNVSVKLLERFDALPQILNEFAGAGVTDLFISSGDGTIQAVQTELAERKPFAHLPRLVLLPHGTTNMTAADLGLRLRGIGAEADFIKSFQPKDLHGRPTLRAANPRDGRPRHGMFLGTGAVSEAARFFQRALDARGGNGKLAAAATLASALLRALFTTSDPADLSRFDRPFVISVDAGGKPIASGRHLLVLATTLEKLLFGTRPFWGGKQAAIRSTIIPYPVPWTPRWLLPVLYGGENRKGPPGSISFSATELAIRSPVSFILDGEFFDGPEGEALRVETGPVFTYVRG